jgi:polar amino acid transport system substrate-binding protein
MCGLKVAVQTGALEEQVMKRTAAACKAAGKPEPKLTNVTETNTDLLAVTNGRSDLALRDPAVGTLAAKQNPKLEVLPTVIPAAKTKQLSGWLIKKDNTALQTALAQAINELVKDGTWKKILDDGGVGNAAILPPMLNGQALPAGG